METNLKNFVSVSVSRMVRETVILYNRKRYFVCAEFRYIFNEKDIENKNVSRCHWKGKKGYGIIK